MRAVTRDFSFFLSRFLFFLFFSIIQTQNEIKQFRYGSPRAASTRSADLFKPHYALLLKDFSLYGDEDLWAALAEFLARELMLTPTQPD